MGSPQPDKLKEDNDMAYALVKQMLVENKNDHCAVARKLDTMYKRGIITEIEFNDYMDILSSIMLWG